LYAVSNSLKTNFLKIFKIRTLALGITVIIVAVAGQTVISNFGSGDHTGHKKQGTGNKEIKSSMRFSNCMHQQNSHKKAV
jgi:hypothetical protein